MMFSPKLALAAALLIQQGVAAAPAQQHPAGTHVEARAAPGPSLGTLCYFRCPDLTGYVFDSKSAFDFYSDVGPTTICVYRQTPGSGAYAYCNYKTPTGEKQVTRVGLPTNNDACAAQAPSAGCGQVNPEPARAFKRGVAVKQMSDAERRLAARQYRAPKAKKSTE